mgnify:FL=1
MKIGFTCGSWDLVHAGHILVFKEAKEHCDYLIVGLQSNPHIDRAEKNTPVMTISERYLILRSVKYIDEIIPYETEKELHNLLRAIHPDIRFIGEDWKGKQYTGYELDIPMYFQRREHDFSTTELRERVFNAEYEKRNNHI